MSRVDSSGFIGKPSCQTEPSISTFNKLRSLEAEERWNATVMGSGVQWAPGTAYLNSIPGSHSPDEWRGSKRSAGAHGAILGAAWPFKSRDLAWLWMRCWACVGPGGLVIWAVLVLVLVHYYPLDPA